MIKLLLDFFITPVLTWSAAAYAAAHWAAFKGDMERSIAGSVILFLILFAYAYETGFKGYYREGRKAYFWLSFVIPAGVVLLSTAIGVIRNV